MMELFSVFDTVVERFMKPFWATNIASATRGFEDACRDPESPFAGHVEDYVLYKLADFSDETGEVETHGNPPLKIVSGNTFSQPARPQLEVERVADEGRA